MQALIQKGKEFFSAFHISTKRILKYGVLLSGVLFLLSVLFFFTAPYTTEYFKWRRVAQEAFLCGKDFMTVFLVFGLIFEHILTLFDAADAQ